jgi:MYXO-CTERM domain-containing protein
MRRCSLATFALLVFAVPTQALADPDPIVVQNPYRGTDAGVNLVDLTPGAENERPLLDPPYAAAIPFDQLNDYIGMVDGPGTPSELPPEWGQIGDMIVPAAMLDGAQMVGDVDQYTSEAPPPLEGSEECAFPDAVPAGVYKGDPRPGGETPRRHTIYLNFVGATLSSGGENSAENISGIARTGHPYPVYGGGEAKAIATAQAVMVDFEFVQTRVVYENRPRKLLPYTMVMVGGSYTDTTAGPSGGVAPLDCEDFGQRNVCYAFQNTAPAVNQANVISQEIGHTFGLGHTQGTDRIMGAGYSGASGDLIFGDDCMATIAVSGQAAGCIGVNKCHCGDPELQHDHNTLLWTYTVPGTDDIAPDVTVTGPEDGAMYNEGETITVNVEVGDNYGGYGWKLVVKDADTGDILVDQADYLRILEWKLAGVPEGTYELIGEIEDQADNITTDSIFITVGPAVAGTDSDGGSGTDGDSDSTGGTASASDSDGGTDSDSDAGSGSDAGSDSGGENLDEGPESCACSTDAPVPAVAGFMLFGLLGLRRRRPAAS